MSERNQKRMQALAAKSVSSWVEPDGVSDGSLIFLIREFLHKCPCPGVSAAGNFK